MKTRFVKLNRFNYEIFVTTADNVTFGSRVRSSRQPSSDDIKKLFKAHPDQFWIEVEVVVEIIDIRVSKYKLLTNGPAPVTEQDLQEWNHSI